MRCQAIASSPRAARASLIDTSSPRTAPARSPSAQLSITDCAASISTLSARFGLVLGSALYYYHDDRLGTPQLVTDNSAAVRWTGNYQPFGGVSITGSITQNLRLPGQYADAETGWYTNGFRIYAPDVGRY
jgi:RHS protein